MVSRYCTPMRIAMIGQKGFPARFGGIERHVEELSRALATQGHEILVYSRSWYTPAQTLSEASGIRVITTRSLKTKNFDAITHTLLSVLNALKERVDIYHFHGVGPALLAWIPRLFAPSARVIITFHCIDRYHQKWSWIARTMLRLGEWAACHWAHQTIVVSKTLHAYCRNEFNVETTYIPNGVTIVPTTSTATLERFGLEPGTYILMVARLIRHKGAHDLITAWKLLKQNQSELLRGLKVVIVGDGFFTDTYVAELKRMAETEQDIVFTGWLDTSALHELYQHAVLNVHPSANEGMPLAVLEAMAHGKTVLVSAIPELQEIVMNPRCQFNVADPADLARVLAWHLGNKTESANFSHHNKSIVSSFTWDHIARETTALYARAQALSTARTAPVHR